MICSVELPTKYLAYSKYFDFDFIIASTCIAHPKYYEYYKTRSAGYVILDNGAFETGQAISDDDYFEIAKVLKPDIIILPDVYENPIKSMGRSTSFVIDFKEKFQKELPNTEFMAVLTGDTERYILSQCNVLRNYGINKFALPYWPGINRYQFLKKHPEITDVHILGLPVLTEACGLSLLKNIKSIDSSLPVKCTKSNVKINHNLIADTYALPDEENLDKDLLIRNLEIFGQVCSGAALIM